MDSSLKEAGLFRRFVAFIIDLAIVAGVWALLSLLVTSRFLAPALGTDRLEEDRIGYLTDVGLFPIEYGESGEITGIDPYYYFNPDPSSDAKEDENGNAYDELPVGFEYAYEAYFDLAYQYVVEMLPTYEEDPRFSPVPVPGEEGKLVGELSYYTYLDYFAQEFFGLPSRTEVDYAADDDPTRLSGDSEYYQYQTMEDGFTPNFDVAPVLRPTIQEKVDAGDKAMLENLALYFLNPSSSDISNMGVYGHAVAMALGSDDNPSQTYYTNVLNDINTINWIATLPAYLPINFIVFFLVPVLSKDNRTIGKWIMRLSVISVDGFVISPKERIFRSLYMFLLGSILALPWTQICFFLYLILVLIDYMALVLSKSKQSIHDRIAHTLEVDARSSIFFHDEEEKEEFMHHHPELFPGYKDPKAEAQNAHIAMLDSILDSSTIDRNRNEARNITSFDEYEKMKDDEFTAALAKLAEDQEKGYVVKSSVPVNLSKEEAPEKKESAAPRPAETPAKEEKEETVDEDAYVDGSGK